MPTTLTNMGHVTVSRDVRQLKQGMAISFEIQGDHIDLRAAHAARAGQVSGSGLIQSRCQAVPADFDVASLVNDATCSDSTDA